MQHNKRQRVPIGLRQLADRLHDGRGRVARLRDPRCRHEVCPQSGAHERLTQRPEEVLDAAAQCVNVLVAELGRAAAAQETLLNKL